MSTVAIGQFSAGENKTSNLREIERLAQTAAKNGAKMLFLPEYSMYYAKVNERSKNIEAAEPCDGPFIIALGELCRRYGLWIAAGMYERTDGLPYNSIAVLDDRGRLRGTHRKNRLYDGSTKICFFIIRQNLSYYKKRKKEAQHPSQGTERLRRYHPN